MQALGLTEDMLAQPGDVSDVELWPDLSAALDLFLACQTQWRTGFNGPTGLDYAGVSVVARVRQIGGQRLRELWADFVAMERAALELFAERRA